MQEMTRLGRLIGFAAWSNEENRDVKEKDEKRKTGRNRRKTTLSKAKKSQGRRGMLFLTTSYIQLATKKNISDL